MKIWIYCTNQTACTSRKKWFARGHKTGNYGCAKSSFRSVLKQVHSHLQERTFWSTRIITHYTMYRGIGSELSKLKRTSKVSLLFIFPYSGVWRRDVWWMCTKISDEPALTLLRVESILVTKVALDPIYQNEGYRSPVNRYLDACCCKKFGFQMIFTGFCYVIVPSTWNPHWWK